MSTAFIVSTTDARLLHRDAVAHILQNGGYNPQ